MTGDQHGGPVVGQVADQVPNLAGPLRVEPVGRLVEDEQIPRHQQRAGDRQPLSHAQGVRPVALAGRRQQAHPVEGGVDAPPSGVRIGEAISGIESGQIGAPGEVGVEGRPLHQCADPAQGGGNLRRRFGAEQRDLTGRRCDQPQQHPNGGGLAGAVGTEEAVDRAVRHGQVDIVHRKLRAKSLAQTTGDHRRLDPRRRWSSA